MQTEKKLSSDAVSFTIEFNRYDIAAATSRMSPADAAHVSEVLRIGNDFQLLVVLSMVFKALNDSHAPEA